MSENQDLSNWIYDSHKASLETLIADFSKVPDSKPSLTPILTRENQTCFGEFIEYKGVKTSYLGAFTKKEEEFLKSSYRKKKIVAPAPNIYIKVLSYLNEEGFFFINDFSTRLLLLLISNLLCRV